MFYQYTSSYLSNIQEKDKMDYEQALAEVKKSKRGNAQIAHRCKIYLDVDNSITMEKDKTAIFNWESDGSVQFLTNNMADKHLMMWNRFTRFWVSRIYPPAFATSRSVSRVVGGDSLRLPSTHEIYCVSLPIGNAYLPFVERVPYHAIHGCEYLRAMNKLLVAEKVRLHELPNTIRDYARKLAHRFIYRHLTFPDGIKPLPRLPCEDVLRMIGLQADSPELVLDSILTPTREVPPEIIWLHTARYNKPSAWKYAPTPPKTNKGKVEWMEAQLSSTGKTPVVHDYQDMVKRITGNLLQRLNYMRPFYSLD